MGMMVDSLIMGNAGFISSTVFGEYTHLGTAGSFGFRSLGSMKILTYG